MIINLHYPTVLATIMVGKQLHSFNPVLLLYIQAEGNYCTFHFTNGTREVFYGSLTAFCQQLAGNCIVQINRSNAINLMHASVACCRQGAVLPGNKFIPVSKKGMQRLLAYHNKGGVVG